MVVDSDVQGLPTGVLVLTTAATVGAPRDLLEAGHALDVEMEKIAGWIAEVLEHLGDEPTEKRVRGEVAALAAQFPLYQRRLEDAEAPGALHSYRAQP